MNNRQLARIIIGNRLASKEQVQKHWSLISQHQNIGEILAENGIITPQIHAQLIDYIKLKEQRRSPNEKLMEGSGDGGKDLASPDLESSSQDFKVIDDNLDDTAERPQETIDEGRRRFENILVNARKSNASDVHITSGKPVILRKYGKLAPLNSQTYDQKDIEAMVVAGIGTRRFHMFQRFGDVEYVHEVEGAGRYRITLSKHRFGWTMAARIIPDRIRTFEESGLPRSVLKLTQWTNGLVLVTGPVGSGKTSTLATLIEIINENSQAHIITIEEPIETVFMPQYCRISQRQVEFHTKSRLSALRGALRQDPDVLVVSELRDLESIQIAVSAAETGHLVLGTMNAANASHTIYQLIDGFSVEKQPMIRNMVSESLRGVIYQQLIPRQDKQGMVAAYEVLIANPAIANLIRKENNHLIGSAMVTGKPGGMVLFDDSLKRLVAANIISGEEAYYHAINPKNFESYQPRNVGG